MCYGVVTVQAEEPMTVKGNGNRRVSRLLFDRHYRFISSSITRRSSRPYVGPAFVAWIPGKKYMHPLSLTVEAPYTGKFKRLSRKKRRAGSKRH